MHEYQKQAITDAIWLVVVCVGLLAAVAAIWKWA